MATEEQREILRRKLGEPIPEGGTEADTHFKDVHLDQLIEARQDDLDAAAHDGWEYKAAIFANLATTSEGGSRRQLSDLHENALKMMDHFARRAGLQEYRSRTRIHTLQRT